MRTLAPLSLAAVAFASFSTASPVCAKSFKSSVGTLKVVTVAQGLSHPWSLAFLPNDGMLVTERDGRMRVVTQQGDVGTPLRGLPRIAAYGQGGLLDVVVDPDFTTNRTIFFAFSEPGPGGAGTSVARAELQDGALENVKIIFRMTPKTSAGRHFGSRIVIARDSTLFVTIGDRAERKKAQDMTDNRGMVIRIRKDGSIPTTNPFVGRNGYRPETWSYGHRNPQGAAPHPQTGDLWIHEHGARGGDEINVSQAGRNYGWPIISYGRHYWGGKIGEGTSKPGMEQPILYWDPSIAPSGMAFVTGPVFKAWRGDLLVGALKYRMLLRLRFNGTRKIEEERLLQNIDERIRDVRIGPRGYIWLLTDSSDGKILRVEPAR